ncbi:MAG: selenide, water dikinase SelD, partial [Pseudomonadales bacterium]
MQVAPVRDLLLVGGGHAHVQVLRRFGMEPVPGVRLTLIAREPHTPYSGMLPGYVAGHYDYDDIHIDLGPLARFANARFIADSVEGMDLEQRHVTLANHPQLRFDAVSLNIGATPKAVAAGAVATTVKPIGQFLPKWRESLSNLADKDRILLLGAGAGAVELAIAMRAVVPASVGIGLVGDTLLPGWNERARKRVRDVLVKRKVGLMESERVVSIEGDTALTQSGQQLLAEHFFDVTGVRSPDWLQQTGLLLDDQGFVRVDGHLRSLSHPQLFAAGDIAHLEGQERPKSGVFAVRAGPVLAKNLARLWSNQPLVRYRAQRHGLALLGTGDGQALGARGAFTIQGVWVERLKQWIDRRFMRRFQALPQMPPAALPDHLQETVAAEIPDPMRCGGCGGKLGAQPLARALARLPIQQHSDLLLGMGDDAARLRVSGSTDAEILLTVDGLSQFVDDPYQFGRIATHHAINDILAMGGKPVAALALATLPVMGETLIEQDLYLLLKGVVEVLAEHDAVLAGGHSAEGPQMALGLTVTGYPGRQLLSKSNLAAGQRLVLSKALGTGVLLAGEMRGQTPSRHLLSALGSM